MRTPRRGEARHIWNQTRGDAASIQQRKESVQSVGFLFENKGGAYLIQSTDEERG